MRIAFRLGLGFGAVTAVATLVGGFLLVQINAIGGVFTDYRSIARQTLAIEDGARHGSEMRTAALRFRLRSDEADARRVDEEAASTAKQIDQAKTLSGGQGSAELDRAASLVRDYARSFAELRTVFPRRASDPQAAQRAETLVAELDRLGPEISAILVRASETRVAQQNALGPQAAARIESANLWGAGLLVLGLVLSAGLALALARALANPIIAMNGAMASLASGRTDVEIPGIGRKDEVGQMAAAVNVFKENALEKARLEAGAEAEKARAEAEKRAAMRALADGFEASVDGVVQSVSAASAQMLAVAKGMAGAAQRASERATTVAAASEEATVNVQTVASASEEMSQSLAEVSGRVTTSAELTGRAANEAVSASAKVGKLAESAGTIGEVIKLISAIAEQTNLLALNATIEAARAGEAGRGFAVVASEVKNLANQTAKATEQIGGQITRMQDDTSGVVSAIEEIGKVIETLNQSAASIAAAVEEQHAATQEIARNTAQAAVGTQQVSTNITDVSGAAAEAGAAADQVLSSAQALSAQADRLRGEVANFLTRVRAA